MRAARRQLIGRWARPTLLAVGSALLVAAIVASPTAAGAAAAQTWPPFVLVTGLLMVGACAHADGLFAALGARVARFGASPRALLVALLGVVAAVSAVLNLDTAVAFLTPVVVLAARAQGLDEEPFLYGALFMSNAASLLLPGSNLTNLLVVGGDVAGASFALRMLPVWLVAVGVTAVFVVVAYRSRLRAPTVAAPLPGIVRRGTSSSTFAVGVAAVLLVFVPAPALPVLALGMALAAGAVRRGTVSAAAVRNAVDPPTLAGVFGIAVALGALARGWSGPAQLLATAGMAETALLGAVASVALNNLPAAVLLASRPPAHATALLLGLNVGPNLAVTGSLSALIWFRAAKSIGAAPSAGRVTRLGIVLVPLTIAAALAMSQLLPAR